jgi:hypothetical protein
LKTAIPGTCGLTISKALVCLLALAAIAPSASAEVIDRVVAIVEGHVITLSDVRQERVLRSQLGDRAVDDDRILAGQLVDNYLVERQIADYPNIDVSDEEVADEIQQLKGVATPVPNAIREAVRRRIRIQKFFDVKFRELIRPTADEISKYYEEVFVPEARKRGLQSVPPLTDPEMSSAIRENVIQESMDHEISVWLEAIRRRSNVEIFN